MKPFLKICGITNFNDARYVSSEGTNAIGFISYPHSKRYISYEKTGDIIFQLNKEYPDIKKVGVFVNTSINNIKNYINAGIDTIQLHGEEDTDFISYLKSELEQSFQNTYEIWKSVSLKNKKEIHKYAHYLNVDKFLLDSYKKNKYGGTGKELDFYLANYAKVYLSKPLILAGGIGPSNFKKAVNYLKPYGIDICSGSEQTPGIKDKTRIRNLLSELNKISY